MTAGSWTNLPSHGSWLNSEAERLVTFAEASKQPVGFAWLDADGSPMPDQPVWTWITARMTHVFALAHLRGRPGAGPLVDHGIAALLGPLRDAEHDGWYPALGPQGEPRDSNKKAYEHAFVVLAAASATAAGRSEAARLLEEALSVVDRRFWREAEGRCVEGWDRTWTTVDEYRGANSNMHFTEAFLAAADVTGEDRWRRRALSIAKHLIDDAARHNGWRLPEHFDSSWRPELEYNSDLKGDPFRPYGTTVGHWLEWARLLLHLEAALSDPPSWLQEDARRLFDAAVSVGWAVDGAEGFVYTLDWEERPVVRARMHWVIAEAIAAAAALQRRTADLSYELWYRTWWDSAARHFIDRRRGSWHHELGPDNAPATSIWVGKPDIYHALQATLLPQLPLAPTLATALRQRLEETSSPPPI